MYTQQDKPSENLKCDRYLNRFVIFVAVAFTFASVRCEQAWRLIKYASECS